MFTGIVTDVGRVRAIRETNRDTRFEIETKFDLSTVDLGASISHAGCCLTVVDKGEGWFAVEVSGETLGLTTLSDWREGDPVNLERAARVGDELGGHIVSGHVDGVGEVVSNESARGLMDLTVGKRLAIGNGILTVEDEDQAWARARASEGDKGGAAARAALEMVGLKRRLLGQVR